MHGFGSGKIILLGEHAVVYGRLALGAGIDRGVQLTLSAPDGGLPPRLFAPRWDLEVALSESSEEPMARAALAVRGEYEAALGRSLAEYDITAEVGLPGGAGLGCSAAFGVALVRALDAATGIEHAPAEVARLSLAWERVFHGSPSGIDNALSTFGGVSRFRRGQAPTPVALRGPLWIVVAESGQRSSTKEMVESVARQHEASPDRVEGLFDAIDALAQEGCDCLREGDTARLGELMDQNHELLTRLDLSSPRLDAIRRIAQDVGALGSKLTGAGGGGCAIALTEDRAGAKTIKEALEERGFSAFVANTGTGAQARRRTA